MIFSIAQLDADTLTEIQSVERETGKTIVAFQGFEATPATLDTKALDSIQALERKLGLSLVAVEG